MTIDIYAFINRSNVCESVCMYESVCVCESVCVWERVCVRACVCVCVLAKARATGWQSQLLMLLHKKGNWTICNEYHGIALLSIPGKEFAKAILNQLSPEQNSFFTKAYMVSIQAGSVMTNSSPCKYWWRKPVSSTNLSMPASLIWRMRMIQYTATLSGAS